MPRHPAAPPRPATLEELRAIMRRVLEEDRPIEEIVEEVTTGRRVPEQGRLLGRSEG